MQLCHNITHIFDTMGEEDISKENVLFLIEFMADEICETSYKRIEDEYYKKYNEKLSIKTLLKEKKDKDNYIR
jgi:hypothetical protein